MERKEEQRRLLTFEEFRARERKQGLLNPHYNNFPHHFAQGMAGEIARKQPHFLRFQEERPDLEQKLTAAITNRDKSRPFHKAVQPLERDLYEAYVVMRKYAGDDEQLFA